MQTAFETAAPVKPVHRTIQFSIKSLLIATTVVALAIGLLMVPPAAAIAMIVVYAVIIAACLVTAFSGRGWIRPFAIMNGIYLSTAVFILLNAHHGGAFAILILLAINLVIGCLVGLIGAVVHGFLARRGGMIPIPNIPFLRSWLHNEPVEIK